MPGPLEGFTPESAQRVLSAGEADAVSFDKFFISNPDLPRRVHLGAPLNPFHSETFYGYGQPDPKRGYTDYSSLLAQAA
jgi:2,4-dienoyl-CoA reductase-like NADH-dependent reductase (Old Yellow Enzyme family)